MASYVKEVTGLIDEGLNGETAIQTFQVLVNRFDNQMNQPEVDDFRTELCKLKKDHLRHFREIIDEELSRFPFPIELSWRNVKFKPNRVKRCAICSDYYYDCSRNGNKITCYNNGICEHEYGVRRKRGSLIDPVYKRRVNEIPTDWSPSSDDKNGNTWANHVELTAWQTGQGRF